jgi:type II secretory pathway component PulC
MRRWFALLVASTIVGCGPKVDPQSPYDVDDPRAGRVESVMDAGLATDAAVDAAVVTTRTVALPRADLVRVLDAGPAQLLRGIEVVAVRPSGGFRGWQLVRILPRAIGWSAVDLEIGDVLLAINHHTLETPIDLSALWDELRTATTIDADLDRHGQTFTIHAEITASP